MNNIKNYTIKFLIKFNIAKVIITILNKLEDIISLSIFRFINKKLKNILDKDSLATSGFKYISKEITYSQKDALKVVYVVNNSLPETNNGYAVRTHYIAKSVQQNGIEIFPVTRVCFPYDLPTTKPSFNKIHNVNVDSLQYFRLYKKGYCLNEVTISEYIKNYVEMLISFSISKNATLLQAASNYINGLAAINVGKILRIPTIYEVRGFWEITQASREKSYLNSIFFNMEKRLEIQACEDATSIIALSDIIKEELIGRGIDKKKIYVVPNGVDIDKLKPTNKKDVLLLKELNITDRFVVGFIGSVVDYEGLHLLIEAAKQINVKYKDKFKYLIVGDGNDLKSLENHVKRYNLESLFVFTGRVDYKETKRYYSIIDVICYPRLDWEVCRIVSPKKPFEAMAYGVPIIASSVRANSYFIKDGVTGLIHEKEDANSLMEKILELYNNKNLSRTISKNAREWVTQNRNAKSAGEMLKLIYEETQKKFYKK